jgi:hypothetical protein
MGGEPGEAVGSAAPRLPLAKGRSWRARLSERCSTILPISSGRKAEPASYLGTTTGLSRHFCLRGSDQGPARRGAVRRVQRKGAEQLRLTAQNRPRAETILGKRYPRFERASGPTVCGAAMRGLRNASPITREDCLRRARPARARGRRNPWHRGAQTRSCRAG